MNLDLALRQGIEILEGAGIHAPRLTAEVLLLHAIGLLNAAGAGRTALYTHPERELSDVERIHYARYLNQRLDGLPTQYVTGRQEFRGLEFRVDPSVLIPRPETEHVVEKVLTLGKGPVLIADCGTGSGCIAIALAKELREACILAGDLSAAALDTAARNAVRLSCAGRVSFFRADLLACLADESIDILVSNPPYVAASDSASLPREVRDFEPRMALFAGEVGTEIYRRLVPEAARVLRPGGWVVLELGYNMAGKVRDLFGDLFPHGGWEQIETTRDLSGIERVFSARKSVR